jgi:hypothetical protein
MEGLLYDTRVIPNIWGILVLSVIAIATLGKATIYCFRRMDKDADKKIKEWFFPTEELPNHFALQVPNTLTAEQLRELQIRVNQLTHPNPSN